MALLCNRIGCAARDYPASSQISLTKDKHPPAARHELARFPEPQHRTRNRDTKDPVAAGQGGRAKRALEEWDVHDHCLKRQRSPNRAPQPPVGEQAYESASFIRPRVEDVENLKQHEGRERHSLGVWQIAGAGDESAR